MSKMTELVSEDFATLSGGFGFDSPLPTVVGQNNVSISDGIISAQKVAVPRNYAGIMQQIKALAAVMGEKYYYSWPTKNRDGSKGRVEGGSIKLAMDLARLFGNCQVDCRVQDTGTHLMIYAKFVDIETGFSLTRPFQQRKNQNTGMKDADRQQDIVLQIGASKAIRNVVLNSMPTLAEYGMQEAKKGLKARIEKNPGEAKTAIITLIGDLNIDIKRVESLMGNKSDKWTINDLTKIWVELNTIKDGYANVEDIYPLGDSVSEATNSINDKIKKQTSENPNHDPVTGEIIESIKTKTPPPPPPAPAQETGYNSLPVEEETPGESVAVPANAIRTAAELKATAKTIVAKLQETPLEWRQSLIDNYDPGLLKALSDKGLGDVKRDIERLLEA